jgi:hypothetical protein
LCWRLDPDTSFSDWTIVIEEEDGTSVTYNVHKCVLAAGKHKSDYFSNVFRSGLSESLSSTSTISLHTLAAAAFPGMLDYMYDSHEQRLCFTVENAVALRYLAQYFGVRSLFLDATRFIKRQLNGEDHYDFSVPPTFLKQAVLFRDETLISTAVDACAAVMRSISSSDLVSTGMPLIIKIVSSPKLNCPSKVVSMFVAEVCRHYAGEIDWATLKALTMEEVIPEIQPNVSLALLKACVTLNDDAEAASDSEAWHALLNRCMDACAPNWKETILAPLRSVSEKITDGTDLHHRQLPPPTQVALLEKALCEAGTEVTQLQEELAALKHQLAQEQTRVSNVIPVRRLPRRAAPRARPLDIDAGSSSSDGSASIPVRRLPSRAAPRAPLDIDAGYSSSDGSASSPVRRRAAPRALDIDAGYSSSDGSASTL